jgi:hypothetical protein
MSLLGQILALVLCFPAVGLLLHLLTVVEMRVLGDLSRPKRHGRTAEGRVPKPDRQRGHDLAPSAVQAARPGPSAAA